MLQKLHEFVRDESSSMSVQALTLSLALAGGAWVLAHGLENHRLGGLDLSLDLAALPLAGAVKDDRRPQQLKMERNFARDTYMFRVPSRKDKEAGVLSRTVVEAAQSHAYEHMENVVAWNWQKDRQKRTFLVPRTLADYLPRTMHFARDVLAAVTTLFVAGRRDGCKVVTTMRELCRALGISANQENFKRIENALAVLRTYTILAQRVPVGVNAEGKVEWGNRIFGFISGSVRVTHITDEKGNEKRLRKKQRLEVTLSDEYARLLEFRFGGGKDLLCAIPLAVIKAAQSLGVNHVVAAKNIVYYLAGRGGKATMTQEKVLEIAGFHPQRATKAATAVSNLLNAMENARIIRVRKADNGDYFLELITTHASAPQQEHQLRSNRNANRPELRTNGNTIAHQREHLLPPTLERQGFPEAVFAKNPGIRIPGKNPGGAE